MNQKKEKKIFCPNFILFSFDLKRVDPKNFSILMCPSLSVATSIDMYHPCHGININRVVLWDDMNYFKMLFIFYFSYSFGFAKVVIKLKNSNNYKIIIFSVHFTFHQFHKVFILKEVVNYIKMLVPLCTTRYWQVIDISHWIGIVNSTMFHKIEENSAIT